tara:strand:- start:1271 stop:2563 length:1293 start_codon:yes stop_codon:yes gene_type:complete
MKFIGQYIQSLIARFRNDVYLEDISTGTIASGGNLGLDSNNKIVKATETTGDLTAITAGTGLSGTNLTGPVPTLNVDASQSQITTLAGVSAIGTAGTPITITSDTVTFTSANTDDPLIKILNTTDNDQGARLFLWKERTDSSIQGGEAGDEIGALYFYGYDNGSNLQGYGKIETFIDVATHGQESGIMQLGVASHDGGFNNGLYMQGGSVDTEVDVTIGTGAASVTTIAGTLTMGSTAAMTNAGLLSVANQSGITGLGTISSGVWQGTAIASAYLDADTMHYSSQRQLTHYMFQDDINTDKIYIGLQETDAESATATNKNLPLLAPVAGKLLKIFVRANSDVSSKTFTWRLETIDTSSNTASTPSGTFGTQSGSGPTNQSMATYDFTSSLDAGSNAIAAGDTVQISVQADSDPGGNIKYYVTCLWEWDLS